MHILLKIVRQKRARQKKKPIPALTLESDCYFKITLKIDPKFKKLLTFIER
jgi:tRNA G26 N,N-dimethylase Trm1